MNNRVFLQELFAGAVAAAHPATCLAPHLPPPPARGRLIVLAAGKAAGAMAEVAERHYLQEHSLSPDRIAGLAVTRHGYGRPTRLVRVIEAGHPVPDAAGLAATFETLALAGAAGASDLVLALISGGERHRLISLVPPVHVCILDPRRILPSLADLLAAYGPQGLPRALTFITGPSRTADIELTITVGIHGPRALHVVLYQPAE